MIVETKAPKERVHYKNYSNISFYDLTNGYTSNEDYFLNNDGFTFMDYVGCLNLSGNELFYYPELAKALRCLLEYPIIKRKYKLNRNIQGKAFIKYFYKTYQRCYYDFKLALANASKQVNNFIYLYGDQYQLPIITSIEERETCRSKVIEYLIINGVKWYANASWNSGYKKQVERLDLKALFEIGNEYSLSLEDVMLNTPFIGIRLKKNWKQKGHIVWYSLETKAKVSKANVATWQKGR